MRGSLLALALAGLVAPALAGCLAKGSEPGTAEPLSGGTPFDARDGLGLATEKALAWNAGAKLVRAFATEGVPADLEDPPFLYDTRADANVGDGRALAWTYAFAAPEASRAYYVSIASPDVVLYAGELHRDAPHYWRELTPVPDGFVASAAAAAAVGAHEKAQAFAAEHPRSVVRIELARDGDAVWNVMRHTATGFALNARVDAATGALLSVERFPDDISHPCPDSHGCHPTQPPTPPEPPADETYARTARLDAFNTVATLRFAPMMSDWAATITITADVGGATPLDAATLVVHDPMGAEAARVTGTGTLAAELDTSAVWPWGGEYLVSVTADRPAVEGREVPITALVRYTEWLNGKGFMADSFGGYVRIRQIEEQVFTVEERASELKVRIAFQAYSPFPGQTATATLFDPEGNEVAKGGSPSAEWRIEAPAPGTYTVRVVGDDTNLLGVGYYWTAVRTIPYEAAYPTM